MAQRDSRSLLTRFTTNSYIAGALPTIGGVMFGLDISSMSAQLSNPYYPSQFNHPDSDLQGGITASMPAGSFGGALINSWLSDKIGRKKCIILSGWIWCIGCAIQSGAHNVATLVAGRVIAGLAVGIASAIVTVYQAEISKPSIRGRIVSIQQLAITVGIFLQYFVQYGCSYIDGTASFRLPWALQLMFVFPESPRWLMEKGREDEALQILADVHGMGDKTNELVQLEFLEIRQQIELDRQSARSYLELLKPDASFEVIASAAQYSLNVIFTFPGMYLIERVGRRPLMLYGAIAMATFLCLVGGLQAGLGHEITGAEAAATTTWKVDGHPSGRNAIIVFSYLFVCSFAVSWGPCSWTYASELFPTKVRGKAVSLSTATNWMFNFALAYATPPAFRNQQWRTYFIFMTFNIVAAIHIFFMFPETKSRTLEEMEDVFLGNAFTAWRVPPSTGKKTLADLEHGAASGVHGQDVKHSHSHDEEKEASSPVV
ncbi:hypothetical protein JCM10450v2_007290 [Rhodotorula kratochvilovae]